MSEVSLLLVAITNFVLLIWFIFTMNQMKANTQELVEIAREFTAFSERRQNDPAAPRAAFHAGMSAPELVAAIEAAGGRLRLLDDVMGVEAVLDNRAVVGRDAARLVKSMNKAVVQVLRNRGR